MARSDGSGLRGPLNGVTEGAGTTQGAYDPTLSMFGRFLSFRSYAPDLTVPDSNSAADVFARQILGAPTAGVSPPLFGAVQRLSVNGAGAEATRRHRSSTRRIPEISGNAQRHRLPVRVSTNLVAGDTNGMVDAFIRAGIFGNGECDFIEATLPGLHGVRRRSSVSTPAPTAAPRLPIPTATARPTSGGAGRRSRNPLLGTFTRYFAEGATKTAGLNFDTRIALANPNNAVVTGEISYQLPSGVAVPGHALHAAALRAQDRAARRAARHRRDRPGRVVRVLHDRQGECADRRRSHDDLGQEHVLRVTRRPAS